MNVPEFVDSVRHYGKGRATIADELLDKALTIIEKQRDSLTAIRDFNLPVEALKKIAADTLDMEVLE